jgi:hypothetical protein
MRILIIALARSGGYQLNEWLALELGYKMIHEPIKRNISTEGKDNIVVKHLINDYEDNTNLYIDLSNWDKIIGLTRTNIKEGAISQLMAIQRSEWRTGYEVKNGWIEENKEELNYFENWMQDKIELINTISEIGLFVSYEGIYDTNEDIQKIKDYIGINNTKYEHLLDNTNRLRNRNKTKRKFI